MKCDQAKRKNGSGDHRQVPVIVLPFSFTPPKCSTKVRLSSLTSAPLNFPPNILASPPNYLETHVSDEEQDTDDDGR